uniref:Neur_chan_LBD domain-containing protein n=1 Tax=Rhabditophanes sp. KR3021 TaxID=114890 RepID=A0AC35UCS6_9BILA
MKIFCYIVFGLIKWTFQSPAEYRLLQDLKINHDVNERPVFNYTTPIKIQIRLLLQQIVDVDEKNQVLTLVVWHQLTWTDYKAVWDPEEYDGVTELQVPTSYLWKPDILLFNSADEHFDASYPVNLVVRHSGDVLYAPPAIIKSSCQIDVTYFPFDSLSCFLKYGSWTYASDKMDIVIDSSQIEPPHMMDLSYYVKNGEWDLRSTPAIISTPAFTGKSFVEIYFYLNLQRKSLYYVINWILPSIIISGCNVLGNHNLTLQITNLLAVIVFLGMVSSVTPVTSDSTPVIAAFFSISMLILGASIAVTILIININFRKPKTHTMSPWVRKVFLEYLPWLLFMNRPGKIFSRPETICANKKLSFDKVILMSNPVPGTPNIRRNDSVANRLGRHDSISSLRQITTLHAESEAWNSVGGPLLRYNPALSLKAEVEKQRLIARNMSQRKLSDGSDDSHPSNTKTRQNADHINKEVNNKETNYRATSNKDVNMAVRFMKDDKFERVMNELSEFLTMAKQKLSDDEEEEDAVADWKYLGMVLDRFCLYFFTVMILGALTMLLVSIPTDVIKQQSSNGTK